MTSLPRVFVFGCGPAGLVAAQAASTMGHAVTVLSKRRKSELWGCQYLHAPIPGITPLGNYVEVRYLLEGSVSEYREKVYGGEYDGSVSPEDVEENHQAWDLRETYDDLWLRWRPHIADVPVINGQQAADFMPDFTRDGIVFSTIPRSALCADRKHQFDAQYIWAMGDSEDRRAIVSPPADNTVLCNGSSDVGWYRTSQVFGYGTVEWPWRNGKRPPFEGVAQVEKPISTNCTCLPDVNYVGRYGKWQKGVLVHQVYDEVLATLETVQRRLF
jgi:hypothetical protein